MKTFTYNRGLAPRNPNSVNEPAAVELHKVNHIDVDNIISALEGVEPGDVSTFVEPGPSGFLYLYAVREVIEAYAAGNLYVMEGNF